jgi:PAS domain-containing protein
MRVVVVSHDITDRKQAEQWERIAATAFESQQGMFITDAAGVILRVNQAFTEITGYSAEECVGQTPRLLQFGSPRRRFLSRDAPESRTPAPGRVKSGTGARTRNLPGMADDFRGEGQRGQGDALSSRR